MAFNNGVKFLMLSGSRPIHSSRVWRATYIVSTVLVFSYIFFDVLDLDGSNFPKLFAPVERNTIVAVVPTGVQLNYSSEQSNSVTISLSSLQTSQD